MKASSWLGYSLIPAALAIGALYWLSFGQGLHYFQRELAQEKRRAEIVNATPLPTAPLEIRLDERRDASLVIERAEIDGSALWVYLKNIGQQKKRFIQIHWKLIAPDGTVVKAGANYASLRGGPDELEPGERAEVKLNVDADPRATVLRLRTSDFDDR